jgi:riboflavin biosynthesis pyrimidine reductase
LKERYGPFGFPPNMNDDRPYLTSNFVMGLDGKAAFSEFPTGVGNPVSRSKDDRWLMDFLRAHHDAQLMGAGTLRDEKASDGKGWDYGIDDQELISYRRETLKLGRPKVIVVTGSGDIDLGMRLFSSSRVESWVLTTSDGERKLRSQVKSSGSAGTLRVISVGEGKRVDLAIALKILRQKYGIQTLLCEGGPTLYAELLQQRLVDEDFRTISLQVMGESTQAGVARPTSYGAVSYSPQTAPWFRLISIHHALPYHVFFRFRYEGPRVFLEGGKS